MQITARKELRISGIKIVPGKRDYPLDHNDPMVAGQLRTLRDDMKVITFDEVLPKALPVADKEFKPALEKARKEAEKKAAAKKDKEEKRAAAFSPRKGKDVKAKKDVPKTGKKTKDSGR